MIVEKLEKLRNKSLDNLAFDVMMAGVCVIDYHDNEINGWYSDESGKCHLIDIIVTKHRGVYSVLSVNY